MPRSGHVVPSADFSFPDLRSTLSIEANLHQVRAVVVNALAAATDADIAGDLATSGIAQAGPALFPSAGDVVPPLNFGAPLFGVRGVGKSNLNEIGSVVVNAFAAIGDAAASRAALIAAENLAEDLRGHAADVGRGGGAGVLRSIHGHGYRAGEEGGASGDESKGK